MKPRTFDCVEMMHRGALRIYEETKGMTPKEQVAYWKKQAAAMKRPRRALKK